MLKFSRVLGIEFINGVNNSFLGRIIAVLFKDLSLESSSTKFAAVLA